MCLGSSPKAPAPPAALPEAPRTPAPSSEGGTSDLDRRRRAKASGGADSRSTILTTPRGATGAANAPAKTLLGA